MKRVATPFRRDIAHDAEAPQYQLVQGLEVLLSEEGRAILLEVSSSHLPSQGEIQSGRRGLMKNVFALSPSAAKQLSDRLAQTVETYLDYVPGDKE